MTFEDFRVHCLQQIARNLGIPQEIVSGDIRWSSHHWDYTQAEQRQPPKRLEYKPIRRLEFRGP